MTTWSSASRGGAHPRTHRGDPAETHRDPLAEDLQDPLEDAHRVDPLEADHRAGEDPLDRADPAEALLEDPLGTPTTHQGTATRIPPGGGLSTSAGGSLPRVRGRHGQGRDGSHLRGRRARAEGPGHRQGRDQVADQRRQRPAGEAGCAGSPRERVGSDHPPLESGSSDDGWGPGPGPGRPHAPGGAPRSRPSASAPSLSAPSHHSAGRRNERVPPGSGSEEWRDEWLSADYHNRRAPPRTPVRPRRPPPAPVPIPQGWRTLWWTQG